MTRTRTTRALAAVLAFLLFATLLFAGMPVRAAGELVLKEGAAITYNKDAAVMKADAVNVHRLLRPLEGPPLSRQTLLRAESSVAS